MKHIRSVREKNNDHKMVDQQVKQSKIEGQLQQLVADRKKNMKQFNISLKLNNTSQTPMPTGDNVSTTPLIATSPTVAMVPATEAFTNYSQQEQYPASTPNLGFYYRPYEDSTTKTQIIESSQEHSPDLRIFNQNNKKLGYQYEKVSPMNFYENKALQCTSGCDANTKFLTKL
jgi:hypothetical protein